MWRWIVICAFLSISFSQNIHIIAHRGSPDKAPENTIASFQQAVDDGATMIEIDVHQTKDGIPVVIHDFSIDRTTDGSGDVEEITFEELKSYSAGSWFDKKFEAEKIPSLEEVLRWLPNGIKLLIEIKDDSDVYQDIEENIWALVKKHDKQTDVIFKSFETDILETVGEIAPDIPRLKIIVLEISFIGLNIERGLSTGSIFDLDVDYVQMHNFGISKHKVKKAHDSGKKIFVWSVDDEDDMKKLIDMGVDGIETDHPEVLRNLMKSYKPKSKE